MPMMVRDAMTAVPPSMTAGQTLNGIQVTPLTAISQMMAQHTSGGMTDANITAATSLPGTTRWRQHDSLTKPGPAPGFFLVGVCVTSAGSKLEPSEYGRGTHAGDRSVVPRC